MLPRCRRAAVHNRAARDRAAVYDRAAHDRAVCDRAAETRRDVESRRCHIEVRMGTIVLYDDRLV